MYRIAIDIKMMKLENIAELQLGVFIKASENNLTEKAFSLSLRDFDENLNYLGTAMEIDLREVKDKYISQQNDVLFSTRMKFNAFHLPKVDDKVYIASNSFVIIRPDVEKLLPEYLGWFLNHPNTQKVFQHLSQQGSRMPFISRKTLGELDIVIPDMQTQKEIAKIDELRNKEISITNKLIEKKETYIQNLLLKSIEK